MDHLKNIIEPAFENRATLTSQNVSHEIKAAVTETLALLDTGKLRAAEKQDGKWVVNQWAKKAVLLSFRWYQARLRLGDQGHPGGGLGSRRAKSGRVAGLFDPSVVSRR